MQKHLHDTGMEMFQAARESYRVPIPRGAVSHLLGFPLEPRKSSGSISVPHGVCRDERSIDTTGCSQGLGRCLLQKPAAMDSQHDPLTVYGIFLRVGFPSRFCRIFCSRASYHGPNHQSTITLEVKPRMKIIVPPGIVDET